MAQKMTEDRIDILAEKWLKGTISAAERQELEAWYAAYNNMEQEVNSSLDEEAFGNTLFNVIASRAGIEPAGISTDIERVAIKTKLWPRIAVAAAAVAAITLGTWLYYGLDILNRRAGEGRFQDPNAVAMKNDIPPGRNTATLTLANGKVINLDTNKTGVVLGLDDLTYSDGTSVTSSLRGKQSDEAIPQTLTASTPRGGTYQVTLPDGTRVWLNADSKISFPSQFIGRERKVVLVGEAYFAVVHDAKQPFRVESSGQVVEDIGTEFNISAYGDEPTIKTTLVEGSASVSSLRGGTTKQSHLLNPNQQAILTNGSIKVTPANTEEAIAWKQGYFRFNNAKIADIMLQLSRWYDIEVVYEGKATEEGLYGKISRYKNITEVLKMLEKTGLVRFKVEGRRVIVKN
jgi:transmembrane sensor